MDNHTIAKVGDRVEVEDGPSELQYREAVVIEVHAERAALHYASATTGLRMGEIERIIAAGPNRPNYDASCEAGTIRIPVHSLYDGGCAVDLIAV